MNQRLAIIVFSFTFVVVFVVGFLRGDSREAEARRVGSLASAPVPMPTPSEGGRRGTKPVAATMPLSEEDFQRAYGGWKDVRRAADGRAIRLETELGADGSPPTKEYRSEAFNPLNQAKAIDRALRVLREARAITGVDPDRSLANGAVSATQTQALVSFSQSIDGVPVVEGGAIHVLLGEWGELRTIESDFLQNPSIANAPDPAQKPGGGGSRTVLYPVSREAGAPELRYGYETIDHGIQTITDAQTGEVLFRRDRRIR